MKALLSFCLLVSTTLVWAGENPAPAQPASTAVKGKVLEVLDVPGYTYLRIKTKDGETWAAVTTAEVKKGAAVTIQNVSVMSNFALKKTFPTILFGALGGSAAATPPSGHAGGGAPSPHAAPAPMQESATDNAPVAKASGADAQTVAEVVTKSAELKDKPVLVRGRVVKFNSGIMGKNWIHLRDGTGSAADKTNDILVTSAGETSVGNIVTVKGTVRTDKDFGSGYTYKVIIEEATLQ
jgi:hypothetical protein